MQKDNKVFRCYSDPQKGNKLSAENNVEKKIKKNPKNWPHILRWKYSGKWPSLPTSSNYNLSFI